MIWGNYDYYDQSTEAAERAERKSEGATAEVKALQRQVDRLALACQAMWEIIRENSDFTEAELEQKMLEIDLRDGKADGKISMQVVDCPACGHKTNTKRGTCIMCGAPVKSPYPFAG